MTSNTSSTAEIALPSRRRRSRACRAVPAGIALVAVTLAGGCAPTTMPVTAGQTPVAQYRNAQGPTGPDPHVPDFVTRGFEPFNRTDTIAIALREWRLFGEPVDDDDPEQRPDPVTASVKPERLPGLWQRVGEYWWIGQDPYESEVDWTGKQGSDGRPFDFMHDGRYAWSAAFISYVMRIAGAGTRFPYSPNHATYINAAASGAATGLRAQDPATYAPAPGDLICAGRGSSRVIKFHNLPTRDLFPAHCGLVVSRTANQLSTVGGNVDDAVTLTHVPTGPTGLLANPDGTLIDTRYAWCAVLQVLYDTAGEAPSDD